MSGRDQREPISGGRPSMRRFTSRHLSNRRLAAFALGALLALASVAACSGSSDGPPSEPVVSGPEVAAEALRRVQLERRVSALDEGWRTAWAGGYARALETAATEWPAAFRRDVAREVLVFGGAALALGLLLGFTALGAPRRSPRPPLTRPAARAMDAAGRAVSRVGRGLGAIARGVAAEDPLDTAERFVRDATRNLDAVAASLARTEKKLGADATKPAREAVAEWRAQLVSSRREARRLAGLGADRHVEGLVALLVPDAAAAERLRVEVQRAESSAVGPRESHVAACLKAISEREPLPAPDGPREAPEWATPSARFGTFALVVALLAVAAWAAAGAIPAVFALAALGLALALRIAGRVAARPGPRPTTARREPRTRGLDARHLATVLTALGAVAFVGALLSASASESSGLDLGVPPPLSLTVPEATPAPPENLLQIIGQSPAPAPPKPTAK
ncbi:MAG: hypothetical protein R3F39_17045 [Myxococcota bacterium]